MRTNMTIEGPRLTNPFSLSEDPSDDTVWILSSTFIIFTMQSGFGLLESGSVTAKNEVNIMVKNAVDVIVGGATYWAFGYALSFGDSSWSNPFCGWGLFFIHTDVDRLGEVFAHFFFQASFATTATTIVSGAMAERTKMEAYIVFSSLNTFIYCFPAHWMWAANGWLRIMGVIDVAGDGPVHLVGGVTGLVATLMLKPRHQRYDHKKAPPMGSPTNALLGMFMLWWGWLGFNCGSTFGISGVKWKLAARSAVATLSASIGGGTVGLFLSYIFNRRKIAVGYLINSILGGLVSITGLCALAHPWEGALIGGIGAMLSLGSIELLDKLKVDDPAGVVGVHGVAGAWGLLAAGLFARPDDLRTELLEETGHVGLFWGGGVYLMGIQLLAVVVITAWTAIISFFFLKVIDLTIGLRMDLEREILGADLVEHDVGEAFYDKCKRKVTQFKSDLESLPSSEDIKRHNHSWFNRTRRLRRQSVYLESIEKARQLDILEKEISTEDGTSEGSEHCNTRVNATEAEINSTPNGDFGHHRPTPPQLRLEVKPSPTKDNKKQGMAKSYLGDYFRRAKSLSLRRKGGSIRLKRRRTVTLPDHHNLGRYNNNNTLRIPTFAPQFHENPTFSKQEEGALTNGHIGVPERNGNALRVLTNDVLIPYSDLEKPPDPVDVHDIGLETISTYM